MKILSRRSVLRGSASLVAASALARPHIANAATATAWFAQGSETSVGPTIPLYEACSPAAAQMDSEHVFQVAWADVARNGMTPEAASEKAFKRLTEIFAKFPIPQS